MSNIFTFISRWLIKASNISDWLRYRFDPTRRYHMVNTSLEPNYYDVDTRMLHACMSLLVYYIEEECGGTAVLDAWNADNECDPDENQAEALEIYRWWTIERTAKHKHDEVWLMKLFGDVHNPDLSLGTAKEYHDYEDQLDKDDDDMLIRLMKIRRYLWT
jgi:hypothetical protein